MLKLLILLCPLGTAPADCTPETAVDVLSRPASPIECALPWQAMPDVADPRSRGLVLVVRCVGGRR